MRDSQLLFQMASSLEEKGARFLKAEFEAEGSRREEVNSLRASTRRANLGLTLKIGGCEAVTDLRDAIDFEAEVIVAPMIESSYAVMKFDEAISAHAQVIGHSAEFLINLETISGLEKATEIVGAVHQSQHITGVVFGRVDFVRSQGLDRDAVDSDETLAAAVSVASVCKSADLSFVVGGAVSYSSAGFLDEVAKVKLSRFETRKVVFGSEALHELELSVLLDGALDFELAWLKAKRNYYLAISIEDQARISMLEKRLGTS